MAGLSARAIAERLDVDHTTVGRWLRQPDVIARLTDERRWAMDRAARALSGAAIPAIAALVQCIQDPNAAWRDKVPAANSILRLLGVERTAQAMDNQTVATMLTARATLAVKLQQVAQRLAEAPESLPE